MTLPHTSNTDLQYGIVLPNWIVGPETSQLVEFAVAAEEAGWNGVYLADHLAFPHADYDGPPVMDFHDPWITMAGIATQTDELTMASWITPIPRRQPWQVARDLATLDRLSDGRVILGTGLGNVATNYTPFGRIEDQRVLGERYDEALEVIDGLWRGEPFSYQGEYFTVNEAAMLPTPVQEPRIPVVAGGVWPNRKPIRRGAHWDGIVPHWPGDGVVPGDSNVDPAKMARELLEYYHEHADAPGEIMLPLDPPNNSPEYRTVCQEYNVTWLYTRDLRESEYVSNPDLAMDRIKEGPPK